MPSLTVWRYPTALGVDAAELRLKRLEEQGHIVVHDMATVMWLEGAKEPRVRRRHSLKKDAGAGSIFGAVLGAALLVPVAGVVAGAVTGAVRNRLREVGIDDEFIAGLQAQITPGSSALFVYSSDAKVEEVRRMIALQPDAVLLYANLSEDAQQRLDELFSEPGSGA